MKRTRILLIAIVCVLAVVLTYWAYVHKKTPAPYLPTDISIDEPAPREYVYQSERGGFSVLIPRGWRVAERTDERTFEVVVYPNTYGDRVPESFSTRTHVSIFPFGTGSGGELPWTVGSSTLANPNDGARASTFITKTNDVWGWVLSFTSYPESSPWRTWGIVYASLDMIQDDAECVSRTGTSKDMRACDPLDGDRVWRGGRIDRADEKTVIRILESVDILK